VEAVAESEKRASLMVAGDAGKAILSGPPPQRHGRQRSSQTQRDRQPKVALLNHSPRHKELYQVLRPEVISGSKLHDRECAELLRAAVTALSGSCSIGQLDAQVSIHQAVGTIARGHTPFCRWLIEIWPRRSSNQRSSAVLRG